VLRIEDSDRQRSTPEAVQAILDSMVWLGLQADEGPFYQTQRLARYQAVIDHMLAAGSAYHCYCTPAEVQAMRDHAQAQGQKPRYDGTWRPEPNKSLPPIPTDRKAVVRFKNPATGIVQWDDMVKGTIRFDNHELDDLIIARADGTPTFNFCVVVDDWDMGITHVLRGDDHVNNTPRQINILHALGAPQPQYGHLPLILGPDGDKLSKRHGAVNVMEYDKQGYLPDAMINYLARLGWSHGNDELFSRPQLIAWFETHHLSKSAAQWDPKKLNWVNAHYLRQMDNTALAQLLVPRIIKRGGDPAATDLPTMVSLLKERAETLEQLAENALLFCGDFPGIPLELAAQHLTQPACEALRDFAREVASVPWTREAISSTITTVLAARNLKMPQLAIPLRLVVTGQLHTPAIDAVLTLLGKDKVLARLEQAFHIF
jgi:glutamyl-tRNA synthetase